MEGDGMRSLTVLAAGLGILLFAGVAFTLKYKYCEYMFGPEKAMVCVFFTK